MSDKKVSPLEWLTNYIEAIEKADTSCEQKLVLPELRDVKNLLERKVKAWTWDREAVLDVKKAHDEDLEKRVVDLTEMQIFQDLPRLASKIQKEAGKLDPMVVDYLDEFIEKLIEQLTADAIRWGNTWLNRPKEGQELRTKARFTDYFDMFENAGIPVPWMKIVGGALICWIRDNHPELCIDAKQETFPVEGVPIIHDLVPYPGITIETTELEEAIADEAEKAVEDMTIKELVESEPTVQHKPGCASYNDPPRGFASSVTDCDCQDSDFPKVKSSLRPNPVAHVEGEKIENLGEGYLAYSSNRKNGYDEKYGKIILDSVVFVLGKKDQGLKDAVLLSTCESNGNMVLVSEKLGLIGGVAVNGWYFFNSIIGVNLVTDVIYVSYDYEYKLPKD